MRRTPVRHVLRRRFAALVLGATLVASAAAVAVAAVLWTLRREYPAVSFDPSWTAIGLGALVFAIWMVLAPNVTDPDPEAAALLDPTALGPLWGPAWVVVRLFGYVVTVPIAEELAFRGFLARRLVSDDPEGVPLGTFTWLSFLGSSLAFGLLHQSAWIPGTIAGAVRDAVEPATRASVDDAIQSFTQQDLEDGKWTLSLADRCHGGLVFPAPCIGEGKPVESTPARSQNCFGLARDARERRRR